MTFDGEHLHIANDSNSGDYFRTIVLPTSNGVAPVIHSYTVAGLLNPTGMAFDSPLGTRLLKLGGNDIDKIYLGSTEVDAVYWGTHEVWRG